jgi:hypothetical protein
MIKWLIILSVFSLEAWAKQVTVSVYCQPNRGCLQDGWRVSVPDPYTHRSRETLYNCLGSGCWFSGWSADYSLYGDFSYYERTECSTGPLYCLHGGWIKKIIREGKVVDSEQATCLPTKAGARSCLDAGWDVQEKSGAKRSIICKQNDCRNIGWIETRNGKLVQDVTCMKRGCFQQGWTFLQDVQNGVGY